MDPINTFTTSQNYPVQINKDSSIKSALIDTGIVAGTTAAGYVAPFITYGAKKKVVNELIRNNHKTLQEFFNDLKIVKLLNRLLEKNMYLQDRYITIKKDVLDLNVRTMAQDDLLVKIDKKLPKLSKKVDNLSLKRDVFLNEIVSKPAKEFSDHQRSLFKNKFNKNKLILAGAGLLIGIAAVITKHLLQKNKEEGSGE